jgi:hypothetical protein
MPGWRLDSRLLNGLSDDDLEAAQEHADGNRRGRKHPIRIIAGNKASLEMSLYASQQSMRSGLDTTHNAMTLNPSFPLSVEKEDGPPSFILPPCSGRL